jgi:hypothetical protein
MEYLPTVALHGLLDGGAVPEVSREVLSDRLSRGPVAAYLYRSFACQAPVADVEALRATLVGLLVASARAP